MPYRQLEALEKEASIQGMTIAHLHRRLLHNWLAELEGARALEEPAFMDAEGEMDYGLVQVRPTQTKNRKPELSLGPRAGESANSDIQRVHHDDELER